MADTYVQLAADGGGKKMDTRTEGTNSEHRQVMVIGDPATNAGVAPVDATKGLAVDLTASGALPTGSNVIGHVIVDTTSTTAVTQATGTNLHAVLDANSGVDIGKLTANQSVNVAQINGVTTLMGNGASGTGAQRVTIANDSTGVLATVTNVATIGTSVTPGTAAANLGKAEDSVHSSGDTGIFILGVSNENLTAFAAASGDYIPEAVNRYGLKYVTAPIATQVSSNGTPITSTTTSVVVAPGAGTHLRVVRIHISNGGSTATWVAIRDGAAGTQHYRTYLPQGGLISLNLNLSAPLDLTSATRLDIVLSAAGSVEYELSYLTVAD